jgi:hypothetical protein
MGSREWHVYLKIVMEGGVDLRPRKAFAENCEFIANTGAAIWHDGSRMKIQNCGCWNCRFKGYDGFCWVVIVMHSFISSIVCCR